MSRQCEKILRPVGNIISSLHILNQFAADGNVCGLLRQAQNQLARIPTQSCGRPYVEVVRTVQLTRAVQAILAAAKRLRRNVELLDDSSLGISQNDAAVIKQTIDDTVRQLETALALSTPGNG